MNLMSGHECLQDRRDRFFFCPRALETPMCRYSTWLQKNAQQTILTVEVPSVVSSQPLLISGNLTLADVTLVKHRS